MVSTAVVVVGAAVVVIGAWVVVVVGAAVVVVGAAVVVVGAAVVVVVGATVVVGGAAVVVVGASVVGVESAYDGCEIPVVRDGVAPVVHTQFGSPSSSPFVNPSPSVSAWHSAVVQERPAAAKAFPKSLRAPPPPDDVCPTPGHETPLRCTLAPLGIELE